MSKIGQRRKQNVRHREIQDARQRREQEWLLYEQQEKGLERLRTLLISAWLLLCLLGGVFIGNENGVLVWAGLSGFGLVAAYQIRSLWLARQAEKPHGPSSGGGN